MSVLKTLILIFIFALMIFSGSNNVYAQTKIRVGTYDSRLIAVAYYNSKFFKLTSEARERMKAAKDTNDSTEISNITKEMSLRQRMIHEQGFGKGLVCYIMDEIKDKISDLAKNEKLSIIVSKWELSFNSSDIEVVDITEKVANLFESGQDIKAMILEFQKNEPLKDAFLLED